MSSLEDCFKEHFSAFKEVAEESRYLSSHNHIYESADFQKIVAMGKAKESSSLVIKLLFEDLLRKSTWETFLTLGGILDYQPEPASVGRFSQMCQELILLGKQRGYI